MPRRADLLRVWTYKQSTGELSHDGAHVATGYSGHGAGRNNPALEGVARVGPLPRGFYTIGPAHDTALHGPVVMALTPDPGQDEHGRDAFLMHGDKKNHDASLGCLIYDPLTRRKVAASPDRRLHCIE
jgi:hypothetical protein